MARLNAAARATLASQNVSPREWTKYHHDADEPCGCLRTLLSEYVRDKGAKDTSTPRLGSAAEKS